MASPQIASGAGLRHVRFWLVDVDGFPSGSQSGSDGYSGRRLEGVKTFQANVPDVQPIRHTGDDRVFAQDHLPPTELETATITTGKTNLIVDAELSGIEIETLGDMQILGYGTDQQGFEEQVIVYGWRQALNTEEGSADFGTRQYITTIYNSCRLTPKGGQMSEGAADENSYNLTPTPTTKKIWGEEFDADTLGYSTAIKTVLITDNPIMIERFDAPGGVTTFLLDFAPITAAKTKAFVDGTATTVASVNVSAKTATLSPAPSAAAVVVIVYETSGLS